MIKLLEKHGQMKKYGFEGQVGFDKVDLLDDLASGKLSTELVNAIANWFGLEVDSCEQLADLLQGEL